MTTKAHTFQSAFNLNEIKIFPTWAYDDFELWMFCNQPAPFFASMSVAILSGGNGVGMIMPVANAVIVNNGTYALMRFSRQGIQGTLNPVAPAAGTFASLLPVGQAVRITCNNPGGNAAGAWISLIAGFRK